LRPTENATKAELLSLLPSAYERVGIERVKSPLHSCAQGNFGNNCHLLADCLVLPIYSEDVMPPTVRDTSGEESDLSIDTIILYINKL
jgi:hypothetical protein